ncbi:serine/threonine-protein kinase [Frankia sp. R82]|uniref:serine/threonine-protein kinase n=1 Tax=Frankia sp. R82 TaxID=2950553 RepID=UPI002042FD2B|nr:serine/threonine-protein kinase [Frankia sp. R82]MCM3884773.1 serine/threonine protein kinase [Frankia sp. R82]
MSTDPAPVAVAALRLSDPVQVGPHRLLGRLGGGGMGVVYLGDGPLGQVAIKIIRSELADNPNFRVRFQRELQACFRVRGSHTATLLDFDITADPPWIATEFLAAPTLEQQVTQHGLLTAAEQRRLAAGLADALVSIHTPGLIHRDLKPSNVMWTVDGPIVIDFGVAAVRDAGQLTVTGTLIGTPGWLSPEQLVSGEIGAAADVFAWGGLICYAATGVAPYGQGPPEAIAYRIVHEEPRVDYSRIAEPLHDIVRQALSREPADRPTAAQLRAALLDDLGPARQIGPGGAGTVGGVGGSGEPDGIGPARMVPETVVTPTPTDSPPPSGSLARPAAVNSADSADSAGLAVLGAAGSGSPTAQTAATGPAGAGGSGGTPPWNLSAVSTRGSADAESGAGAGPGAGEGSGRTARPRRRGRALGVGAALVVLAAAAAIVAVILTGGDDGSDDSAGGATLTYTATGPWRLMISDRQSGNDEGCTVTTAGSGNPPGLSLPSGVYGEESYQVHLTGDFTLDVSPAVPGCVLQAIDGAGDAPLPFTVQHNGDSTAFQAPPAVEVQVRDFNGSETCDLVLRDVDSGEDIDVATAAPDAPTVRLDPGGHSQVYLAANGCVTRIAAAG